MSKFIEKINTIFGLTKQKEARGNQSHHTFIFRKYTINITPHSHEPGVTNNNLYLP